VPVGKSQKNGKAVLTRLLKMEGGGGGRAPSDHLLKIDIILDRVASKDTAASASSSQSATERRPAATPSAGGVNCCCCRCGGNRSRRRRRHCVHVTDRVLMMMI